jgi:hypothetical protein
VAQTADMRLWQNIQYRALKNREKGKKLLKPNAYKCI